MAAEKLGLEVAIEGFKQFMSQMGQMDGAVDKTGKKWGGLSGIAGKAGAALGTVAKVGIGAVAAGATTAVAAIGGLTTGISKLAMEAAPVAGLQSAFAGLTADIAGGSDAMLRSLQDASMGMIANRDLMESFNKAAALVSKDFAQQLPDAMQYLGKVSAATGTDLDYLLDSLVTGVGRLSPMILDNLAIQVNATEANEAYALSIGKNVDELTKAEQQTAMMNQVLEKLAVNTADLPDVSESAAQGMANFQATIQNVKDEVGIAFLPALQTLMGEIGKLATRIGPKVIEWAQKAGTWLGENLPKAIETAKEIIEKITFAFEPLANAIKAALGGDTSALVEGLDFTLRRLFGDDVADMVLTIIENLQSFGQWFIEEGWPAIQEFAIKVYEFLLPAFEQLGEWIQQAAETIWPLLIQAFTWIKENMEIVLPILAGIGLLIAALNAPILLIVGAIILFAKAWAENWGGIQEKVTAVVDFLKDLWDNVLLPAMQTIWDFIVNDLIPIFKEIAEVATVIVGEAIRRLTEVWETTLKPALDKVWDFIENNIIPVFEAAAEVAEVTLGLAITALAGLWDNVLQPALENVWNFIQEHIIPIFEEVSKVINDTLGKALEWLADTLLPKVEGGLKPIKDAIGWLVDWLGKLAQKLRDIELPWWLQPHSPPPLAFAFDDIAAAVRQLSAVELPHLIANFNAMGSTMPIPAMPGGNTSTYNYATTHNYNLTTQSITRPGGLQMEFDAMALATR